jgi:hypothetical protein
MAATVEAGPSSKTSQKVAQDTEMGDSGPAVAAGKPSAGPSAPENGHDQSKNGNADPVTPNRPAGGNVPTPTSDSTTSTSSRKRENLGLDGPA